MSEENKGPSLGDLLDERDAIRRAIVSAEGEISDDLEIRMAALDLEEPKKVDAWGTFFDMNDAMREMLKKRVAPLLAAIKRCDEREEFGKRYLKNQLVSREMTQFRGNEEVFKISEGREILKIDSPELIPDQYFKERTIREPDKFLIEDALKIGYPIPGARLEKVISLRRSMNTENVITLKKGKSK